MTELEKAARQALEALNDRTSLMKWQTARDALRQALEQPVQIDPSAGTQVSKVWWDGDKLMAQPIPLESIYKEPEQPAQQEPVANYCRECLTYNGHHEGCSHYTRPQAREPLLREIAALSANALDDYKLIQKLMAERQPLTDAEIESIRVDQEFDQWAISETAFRYAARAIEAKLREKNGGKA